MDVDRFARGVYVHANWREQAASSRRTRAPHGRESRIGYRSEGLSIFPYIFIFFFDPDRSEISNPNPDHRAGPDVHAKPRDLIAPRDPSDFQRGVQGVEQESRLVRTLERTARCGGGAGERRDRRRADLARRARLDHNRAA